MRALLLCILGGFALGLAGCASTTEPESPTEPGVSNLAWGKADRGDGQQGMFGAFQPQN